jgi:YVTN family beta-propeller protein
VAVSRARRAQHILIAALALVGFSTRSATPIDAEPVGPGPNGTVLPTGHGVTPAGRQIRLGDLPLGAAASPDGHRLVVSNAGEGSQSLQVIDTATGAVVQTLACPKPEAVFTGLVFSRDGHRLFVSGGGNNEIRTFNVSNGLLSETAPLRLPATSDDGAPINAFPAGLAITGDGRVLAADRLADAVTALDPDAGAPVTIGIGHAPGAIVESPDGNRAWMAEQGADTVRVLDVSPGRLAAIGDIRVGTHPAALALDKSGSRLFVANADTDDVTVVDTATSTVKGTIALAPYPGAQVGANPVGLALSDDDKTLFVADCGDSDIAVIDTDRQAVRSELRARQRHGPGRARRLRLAL